MAVNQLPEQSHDELLRELDEIQGDRMEQLIESIEAKSDSPVPSEETQSNGFKKSIYAKNTPIQLNDRTEFVLKPEAVEPDDGKTKNGWTRKGPAPYTPLGTGSDLPTMELVEAEPEVGRFEALVAGMAPSGRDLAQAVTEVMRFERDSMYNPEDDFDTFKETHGVFSEGDVNFLLKAESKAAFEHRAQYLLGQRERDRKVSKRPILGTIGGFVDYDIGLAAIPVAGSAAKGARMAQRAAQGVAAAGAQVGVNEVFEDNFQRDEFAQDVDVVVMGLAGAFAMKRVATPNVAAAIKNTKPEVTEEAIAIPAGPNGERIVLSRPLDANAFPKGSVEHKLQAQIQSVADEMIHYTNGDMNNPLNRLVSNPVVTQGDDATNHAITVARDAEVRLAEYEMAIDQATRELHGSSPVFGRLFKNLHAKNQREVAHQVFVEMQKVDQRVVEASNLGKSMTREDVYKLIDESENDAAIKKAMRAYVDTGYAEMMYDHIKRVGMLDDDALELILKRDTYQPLAHSYERIWKFAARSEENMDAIKVFIGKQIARSYPDLLTGSFKLTHKQIGDHFIQTQRNLDRATSPVQTIGMTKEGITALLTKQGMPVDEAAQYAEGMFKQGSQRTGTAGNLKQRITWDWFKEGTLPDGRKFSMADLVSDDAYGNLTSYSRRMAHRIGLAQYGFKKVNDLDKAIADTLDNLPAGTNPADAKKFLENVRYAVLGHGVGENVPQALRNLNTMSGMFLLANSGLYNIVDATTQLQKMGLIRSLPHIYNGLRPMFKGMKGFTVNEAKSFEDIITGKLMSLDRWKNIHTHFADDFEVGGGFTEAVEHFGQSTRFLNGSEFVKRWQIGVFASMYVDALKGASKGQANHIKFLKEKLFMSDELIDATSKQYAKHGSYIDKWDPEIRIAMEQKVFHEADNLAHTVQLGEVPAVMEFSQVGKVVFPFMRYMLAMQNKVLRRTYARDGAAAVAMVLACQFPLAVAVAAAKEAMKGRDPSKELDIENAGDAADVARKVMTAMPALGSVSYPLDLILSGGANVGGGTVLAPITQSISLGKDVVTGEATVRDFKEKTPLNVAVGLNAVLPLFDEETE